MDNSTYTEHFMPFFLRMAAIQVSIFEKKPLTEEETKFVKIIKILPSIVDRYINNQEITLEEIKLDSHGEESPMSHIDNTNSIIDEKPKITYTFGDFNSALIEKEYLETMTTFFKEANIDLNNRLNNKSFIVQPI